MNNGKWWSPWTNEMIEKMCCSVACTLSSCRSILNWNIKQWAHWVSPGLFIVSFVSRLFQSKTVQNLNEYVVSIRLSGWIKQKYSASAKKSVHLTVNYDMTRCFHAIPLRGIRLVHDEYTLCSSWPKMVRRNWMDSQRKLILISNWELLANHEGDCWMKPNSM